MLDNNIFLLLIIVIILFLTLNNTNNTTNNSNTTPSTNDLTYNNILHLPLKEGKETESVFSDTFLTNTSLAVNALDNLEARMYVDKRCITNKIPLFESGTLGTKGNVQVVIPYKTESYSSSRDPLDKSIPFCTIRNFPHRIEHTIYNFEERIISISEYIKCNMLEGDSMDRGNNYKGDSYKDNKQDPVNNSLTLYTLLIIVLINKTLLILSLLITPHILLSSVAIGEDIRVLVSSIPKNIYECVREDVILFNKYFYINIKTLIETFPVGHVTGEGQPFWVPPKRPPVPLIFNKDDCLHVLFVQSYCRVICSVYGIKGLESEGEGNGAGVSYKEVKNIIIEWMYDKGILEGVNDKGSKVKGVNDMGSKIKGYEQHPFNHQPNTLHTNTPSNNNTDNIIALHPVTLEKDNDSNGHIDFIYACANLRAHNYNTKEVSKLTVKGIAGRIIQAIATTTSVISGLCVLEMIRYVLYGNGYKNWYFNLGLSFIGCTDVIEAEKMECGMVRCDSRERGVNDTDRSEEGVSNSNRLEGVSNRDRLEGVSISNGLEGVSNRDRLEGVSDSNGLKGVNYSTNTLHPNNTTTFTL
ncbi:ubiquitin-activating enzyme [Hamiltosporidium tvaerminnensis]|uniref:Ubiquitin-activating enzyme n=1 Tax=Hamiltosporidium tvaerminnensis TaxID=1176355 RepID=A0A4Q9M2F3_9MICR|nr:ubiquitin-activating enzyme [Hamiltosporidium tvaerminnensis]